MSEIPNSEPLDTRPIRMFAVVVDNEYTGVVGFPESPYMEAVIAGLSSNPTIIPVTRDEIANVQVGFIWDGSKFNRPE